MRTQPKIKLIKSSISFENTPIITEQHHKESCDIHNIMHKYQQTGVINHVNQHTGTYQNFTDAPGFYEAQLVLAEANSMFETVPAHIRKDFGNDPAAFLGFIQNPKNIEAIEAYGLDASHLTFNEDKPNQSINNEQKPNQNEPPQNQPPNTNPKNPENPPE